MSDLILYNGRLITMDPATEGATALSVHDGKINHVGRTEDVLPLVKNGARKIDLGGATLLPGFNDAHIHVWKVGDLLTGMLDVRQAKSIREINGMLRDFSGKVGRDGWILARGYNEAHLEEKRHPTRHDLDEAVPGRPVWLVRTCGHIAVASSRAMDLAGITRDTEPCMGGVIDRDEAGEPTGIFHETSMGQLAAVIPPPTASDYRRMILAAGEKLLSHGITSATDPAVTPELIDVYTSMDLARELPVRMNLLAIVRPDGGSNNYPLPKRSASTMLRLDSVKFFADGGLSGATAALKVDYKHIPSRGVLRFGDEEEFHQLARDARAAGLRIGVHAIGDAAIEQVLRVYERISRDIPGPANRIEHLALPDEKMLKQAARLGVIAVSQAIFLHELGGNFRAYLPENYLPRVYPFRSMIKAGIPLALSSDAPVVQDFNPLSGVRSAVVRSDKSGVCIEKSESLSVMQALYSYTMGGAIASGDASNRGSLSPSKWADMVVLDHDPRKVEPDAIPHIPVRMTFRSGQLVHET